MLIITSLSGLSDALGFVHASRAWDNDRFVLREAVWALVLFVGGIVTYVVAMRYFARIGVTSAEIQTLIWFSVTVIGVAAIQRTIVNWGPADRVMAAVAAISVGWRSSSVRADKPAPGGPWPACRCGEYAADAVPLFLLKGWLSEPSLPHTKSRPVSRTSLVFGSLDVSSSRCLQQHGAQCPST